MKETSITYNVESKWYKSKCNMEIKENTLQAAVWDDEMILFHL
jgi:hypothetical protein